MAKFIVQKKSLGSYIVEARDAHVDRGVLVFEDDYGLVCAFPKGEWCRVMREPDANTEPLMTTT